MLCEHANPLLIDYAQKLLNDSLSVEVETHLESCASCQSDFEAINMLSNMAQNWHDETVPAWQPAPITNHSWLDNFRLWFPTAASTAALAVATMIFVQMPESTGVLPASSEPISSYQALPELPQATQAAMVERVMEGSREQRQEELQVLLQYLKAEMDRRTIETEDSLRFVITNQLQGQQELDELYRQVKELVMTADNRPGASAATQDTGQGVETP
ncbi:MAG: zf-HC2 domain-containing protein [bacterium]